LSFKGDNQVEGMAQEVPLASETACSKKIRPRGHKNWKSTQKYVHLVQFSFKEEDFDTTVATTPEEILVLGKSNWQKYDEANGCWCDDAFL
jgi:hypothetical protein